MGEFIEIGAGGAPLQLISGLACAAALGLYAIFQPIQTFLLFVFPLHGLLNLPDDAQKYN